MLTTMNTLFLEPQSLVEEIAFESLADRGLLLDRDTRVQLMDAPVLDVGAAGEAGHEHPGREQSAGGVRGVPAPPEHRYLNLVNSTERRSSAPVPSNAASVRDQAVA
jgi:hypothetical protein